MQCETICLMQNSVREHEIRVQIKVTNRIVIYRVRVETPKCTELKLYFSVSIPNEMKENDKHTNSIRYFLIN